jgi:hypothetical protein
MENNSLPQEPHEILNGPLEELAKLQSDKDSLLLTRRFQAYAPPSAWGSWVQIASHGGIFNFSISYEAIGNTNAIGAVFYYGSNGKVTQQFNGSIDITTGNVWANVFVCFRGAPLGTAIQGTINP